MQPGGFTTAGAGPTLRLTDGRTLTRSYFSTNENLDTCAAQNIAVPTSIFQNLDRHLQQRGLYWQDEAKLGNLTVLGGVRYDWAEGDTLAQNTGLRVLNNDQKPTSRAGSTISTSAWRPMSAIRPHASRPRSVRCSTANRSSRPPASNTAAVYDLVQQNVISTIAGPGIPANTPAQVGEVTSRGFEGSVVGRPMPGLNVRGQYSDIDNKITGNAHLSMVERIMTVRSVKMVGVDSQVDQPDLHAVPAYALLDRAAADLP